MSLVSSFLIIAVAFICYYLYAPISIFYFQPSFLTEFKQSDLSKCTNIPELKGCEDFAIDYDLNIAIVGCPENYLLNKQWVNKWYVPKSKVQYNRYSNFYIYDINTKKVKNLNIIDFPKEVNFAVHGMDIIRDEEDKDKLHVFAINHRFNNMDTIEHFIYKINSDDIKYKQTFSGKLYDNLNSVVAVTSSSFYASKDIEHYSGIFNYLETHGILAKGKILYHGLDGDKIVATNLRFANGLALNYNKNLLYVAENLGAKIHVYSMDEDTGDLELKDSLTLSYFPDNLKVNPSSGAIYVAGFAKYTKNYDYFETYNTPQNQPIASIAARITNETGEAKFFGINYKSTPLLMDQQGHMSTTTTVAGIESLNRVLMSGLLNPKGFLDCPVELT